MNEVARIEPQAQRLSITNAMATRFNMEADTFMATLTATVFGDKMSREEKAAFLVVAWEYRLNPITREIYAMPKKGGGIIPVVSIDGWVRLANEHPQFDGMEFAFEHEGDKLVSTTCKIYRKDRSHPIVVTEYLSECKRDTDPWKMQHRMLRHKAMIQCARYAFGFAGIYDQDEAERFAASPALVDQRRAPSASAHVIEHHPEPEDLPPVEKPTERPAERRRAPSATPAPTKQETPPAASAYDPEAVRKAFDAAAAKATTQDQLNEAWETIVGQWWDSPDLPTGHPDRDDLDNLFRLHEARVSGQESAGP